MSIAATNARSAGGQFVVLAKAYHNDPYDGHTLETVFEEIHVLTGVAVGYFLS